MRGLLLVGCMFIGSGLGLAVDQVAVGGALGLGVGFIAMALVRTDADPIQLRIPTSLSGLTLVLVGIGFIIGGLSLLFDWDFWHPYLSGGVLVLIGTAMLVVGTRAIRAERRPR